MHRQSQEAKSDLSDQWTTAKRWHVVRLNCVVIIASAFVVFCMLMQHQKSIVAESDYSLIVIICSLLTIMSASIVTVLVSIGESDNVPEKQ